MPGSYYLSYVIPNYLMPVGNAVGPVRAPAYESPVEAPFIGATHRGESAQSMQGWEKDMCTR